MKTFKTKQKIVSFEINVETFEKSNFVISPAFGLRGRHVIDVFCQMKSGFDSICGSSEIFTFEKNTVIIDHCKSAYSNLIKNIEKFVEENESC